MDKVHGVDSSVIRALAGNSNTERTSAMRHENSLMHDVLKPMPWGAFDRLVEEHGADRRVRELSTKSQFIALAYAQLCGAHGLRDIEARLASQATRLYHLGAKPPKRSTLSDANRLRPAGVYAELFGIVAAQTHRGLRKATKEAIRLVDATSVSLTSLSDDWASYPAHGSGAKLHVVYDPDAQVPVRFTVTAARINDILEAKAMPIEAGVTMSSTLDFMTFPGGPRSRPKVPSSSPVSRRTRAPRSSRRARCPPMMPSSPISSSPCRSAWRDRARTP